MLALGAAPRGASRRWISPPRKPGGSLEGVRIPLVLFADPTGRVRYQPPGDWHYGGEGATFTLYPPHVSSASMKLCVVPHAPGLPEITAMPSAVLTKWSQQYVAADAQELKLVDEMPSPFMLDSRPSREFIFAYKASGQRFQTSVAVLDWSAREHLAVVVTAAASEFKTVHDNGISSLFSWSLRKTDIATPAPATTAPPPPHCAHHTKPHAHSGGQPLRVGVTGGQVEFLI